MKITKCIYCGSEDITEKVRVTANPANNMTLQVDYKIEKKSFFGLDFDSEPILADMCNVCGSVIRFYAKNPHNNWITFEK